LEVYIDSNLYMYIRKEKKKEKITCIPEPIFVDLLRSPGIDPRAARSDNPICRTGPPGSI
jgi:hypothetical protein